MKRAGSWWTGSEDTRQERTRSCPSSTTASSRREGREGRATHRIREDLFRTWLPPPCKKPRLAEVWTPSRELPRQGRPEALGHASGASNLGTGTNTAQSLKRIYKPGEQCSTSSREGGRELPRGQDPPKTRDSSAAHLLSLLHLDGKNITNTLYSFTDFMSQSLIFINKKE